MLNIGSVLAMAAATGDMAAHCAGHQIEFWPPSQITRIKCANLRRFAVPIIVFVLA